MSDISMVPESTLPETSSEAREREERPAVMVPATQESPVPFRLQDEVHDMREDLRRLATRLDGVEERFDRLEKRIDGQFDHVKEWCGEAVVKLDRMDENWKGMETLQRRILAQLAEKRS